MNNYASFIKLLKRIAPILIIAAVAGVLSALTLAPPAWASSPIFVRPGGDDLFCNGTANVDYSSTAAPTCAVKTWQRAVELAGPDRQVSFSNGRETVVIPYGGLTPAEGIISAQAVATLTVSKHGSSASVLANQPLTYTILITNPPGSVADGSISLIDTLGWQINAVTFKSVTSTRGVCNDSIVANVLIVSCSSINLVANDTATVTVVVTPTAAGILSNGVDVIPSNTNLSGSSDTEYTEIIGQTDLSVSKLDQPDPVLVNTPLTYTLVVTNSGPNAINQAILTDTLPASVVFDPLSSGCTYSAPTLTCTVGYLGVHSSTTRSFVVTPTVLGVITNTAGITVTPGATDLVPGNNLATQTTQVVSPTNLAVAKTAASTWVVPGQTMTYTIWYSNTSDYPAAGVVISDVLPAFTSFVSDDSGFPRSGSGSGPILWAVGAVPSHTVRTFVLTTSLSSGATCSDFITNTISIDSPGGELNIADNRAAVTRQILCGVNLVVVKNDGVGSGDPRPNVTAGDYITYTISVNNRGNQLAANVVLSETLPANTTFEAARSTSGWTAAGSGVYTISLGNLSGNGGGDVVRFVVRVDPNLACPITQTVNTAVANSNGPEIYPPDNTSNEQTPLICSGQLQVQKDDGVICAAPNQTITYTITYSNTGSAPANNVFLTDFKPTYTNFLPGNGWVDAGGGVYTHTLGTVPPGGPQGPVYFWVQLADRTAIPTNVTAITNVIQISGGNTFTEVTSVPLAPDLVIAKNDNIGVTSASSEFVRLYQQVTGAAPSFNAQAANVGPGDFIEYTVVYANNGRAPATNVVLTDTLPLYTTYAGGPEWTPVSGQLYRHTVGSLNPGDGGFLTFRVQVTTTLPSTLAWIINRVDIGGSESSNECNSNNSFSYEQTPVYSTTMTNTIYLPIILKQTPPSSGGGGGGGGGSEPPAPLAYVSDVKADPDTNQVFVASPRHDWVYVINGSSDTLARNVPVGHGPTGLTVLKGGSPANNKIFVAHQYGANFWRPGFMAFGVDDTSAHNTSDTGYAGAAPIKTAANSTNNRVYVSNYFDKLAVYEGGSETRLDWVVQKAFQGAYGIDTSAVTQRVYLATRDTGELVVFDGNNDRLLQGISYIPTHVKPPQPCSLFSVAVNEATGHVFVPCPQLGRVFVLQENQVSVLDLEALGVLEERDGYLALVVSPQAAPWIADIPVSGGVGLGEEGIAAVNSSTGYVFITNAQNNTLVVLRDGPSPSYVTTVNVGTRPQGVDVNPATQKVYVGNTGSNNVTVLSANSPFTITKTIPLAP